MRTLVRSCARAMRCSQITLGGLVKIREMRFIDLQYVDYNKNIGALQ